MLFFQDSSVLLRNWISASSRRMQGCWPPRVGSDSHPIMVRVLFLWSPPEKVETLWSHDQLKQFWSRPASIWRGWLPCMARYVCRGHQSLSHRTGRQLHSPGSWQRLESWSFPMGRLSFCWCILYWCVNFSHNFWPQLTKDFDSSKSNLILIHPNFLGINAQIHLGRDKSPGVDSSQRPVPPQWTQLCIKKPRTESPLVFLLHPIAPPKKSDYDSKMCDGGSTRYLRRVVWEAVGMWDLIKHSSPLLLKSPSLADSGSLTTKHVSTNICYAWIYLPKQVTQCIMCRQHQHHQQSSTSSFSSPTVST